MFDKSTRILVVDDMMMMRKVVKKCLLDFGFSDVTEADDGETAWAVIEKKIAENTPIQLILTDWNMAKMKGIDLLRKVRAFPATQKLPVIMITAESEKNQILEAVAAGMTGYIVKPFTSNSVIEKLKAAHAVIAGK
ncbi:MAG: response regulator [Bdellovibrionota bacterium]